MRNLKFVLAFILIIAANQAVSLAVEAASPQAYLPKGYTRYAAVAALADTSTDSNSYVDIDGLSTTIKIPSGKKGDVFVLFCGAIMTNNTALVRAQVQDIPSAPSDVSLESNNTAPENRCANFFMQGVSAGTKTVKMQWANLEPLSQSAMGQRSIIVIVNIR